MLRALFYLIPLFILACSADRQALVAPAGKATQMGMGNLLGRLSRPKMKSKTRVTQAKKKKPWRLLQPIPLIAAG